MRRFIMLTMSCLSLAILSPAIAGESQAQVRANIARLEAQIAQKNQALVEQRWQEMQQRNETEKAEWVARQEAMDAKWQRAAEHSLKHAPGFHPALEDRPISCAVSYGSFTVICYSH